MILPLLRPSQWIFCHCKIALISKKAEMEHLQAKAMVEDTYHAPEDPEDYSPPSSIASPFIGIVAVGGWESAIASSLTSHAHRESLLSLPTQSLSLIVAMVGSPIFQSSARRTGPEDSCHESPRVPLLS